MSTFPIQQLSPKEEQNFLSSFRQLENTPYTETAEKIERQPIILTEKELADSVRYSEEIAKWTKTLADGLNLNGSPITSKKVASVLKKVETMYNESPKTALSPTWNEITSLISSPAQKK